MFELENEQHFGIYIVIDQDYLFCQIDNRIIGI